MNSKIIDEKVKIEIQKRPFLPIFINGEGPCKFLLDTGDVSCTVSPEVAQKLQLKREDVPNKEAYVSVVEFSIGRAKWRNVIYVDDCSRVSNLIGTQMDGLIGHLFLKGLKVTINYPEETVVVETSKALEETQNLLPQEIVELHIQELRDLMNKKQHFPTYQGEKQEKLIKQIDIHKVKLQIKDRLPVVPVFVNGEGPYQFILDTGASVCVVSPELSQTLGLEYGKSGVSRGISDEKAYNTSYVKTLAVGAVQCTDLEVIVMDCSHISERVETQVDGYLGYGFLKEFSVTINYPEQTLTLE